MAEDTQTPPQGQPKNAPRPTPRPGDQPTDVPEPSNTRPPGKPTPNHPSKPLTGENPEERDDQDENETQGM